MEKCIYIKNLNSPSLTPAAKSEIMVSNRRTRAVSPIISSSADDITFEGQHPDPHSNCISLVFNVRAFVASYFIGTSARTSALTTKMHRTHTKALQWPL